MASIISFDQFIGPLGTSQAYTTDNITVTAYGYAIGTPDTPTNLFGRSDTELGLGIANNPLHEINTQSYVTLDLCELLTGDIDGIPTITVTYQMIVQLYKLFLSPFSDNINIFLLQLRDPEQLPMYS